MTEYDKLNAYVGKPFSPNGRGPDSYDCWGLVAEILSEQKSAKLPTWFVPNYTDMKAQKTLSKGLKQSTQSQYVIEKQTPENYDIVLLSKGRVAYHVGVFIDGYVLHVSSATKGVVYQDLKEFNRQGDVRFYRWVG